MSIEEKKNYISNDKLYQKFLEEYSLRLDFLEFIIEKITDDNIKTNEVIVDDLLTTSKFIILLKYLLDTSASILYNIIISDCFNHYCLFNNKDLIEDYFFNTPIEEDILLFKVKRIIVNNFIDSAKYVKDIKDILEDNDIEYKDIFEYSTQEVDDILKILLDIIRCTRDGYKSVPINNLEDFSTINDDEYVKRFYDNDKTYYKYDSYKVFLDEYKKILSDYNSKKKYLKYFSPQEI